MITTPYFKQLKIESKVFNYKGTSKSRNGDKRGYLISTGWSFNETLDIIPDRRFKKK